MSKAILIIDTPNNCYECPCFMDEGWRCQNRLDINEEVHDGRPSWCPLIEADAVPVRHGKWIIRDNPGTGWYRVTCSECGEDVTSTAPCIGFFPNAKVSWNYCPNCGAKMDEVDE